MSFTSAPAQNTDPVPVSTTAPTSSVSTRSRTASPRRVTTSGVTELPLPGRFSRTVPTPSVALTTISSTLLPHFRHVVRCAGRLRDPRANEPFDIPTGDLGLAGGTRDGIARQEHVARALEAAEP